MKKISSCRSTSKGEIFFLSPQNLKDADILKRRPNSIDEEKWLDISRIIIGTIIQLSIEGRFKNSDEADINEEFVSLSSEILKRNCGNDYSKVINGLIKSGIIEFDNQYSTHLNKTYGYRLSKKYRYESSVKKQISNYIICNKIKRELSKVECKLKPRIKNLDHLCKWLKMEGLEINKKDALKFVEQFSEKLLKEVEGRKKSRLTKKQLEVIDRRVNYLKFQIENWGNLNYLTVDDKGGRLYSPIVGLPSILRNFLTFKGQKLIGYDIKNSQPLHFLLMMREEFWQDSTTGLTLRNLDRKLYTHIRSITNINPTIMFQESPECQYNKGFYDFENNKTFEKSKLSKFITFQDLVKSGTLYEYFSQKFYLSMTLKGNKQAFLTRSGTKSKFMHLMYHNPNETYSSAKELFKELKKLFPLEAGIMELMKSRKYNDLPILLQKIEAEIILKDVTKKINELNPNIPLFTIHDSILTTEPYEGVLKKVLDDVYNEYLGFIPQFEKTIYSEYNATLNLKKYVQQKASFVKLENASGFLENLKVGNLNIAQKMVQDKYNLIPDYIKYSVGPSVFLSENVMYPNGKRLKKH